MKVPASNKIISKSNTTFLVLLFSCCSFLVRAEVSDTIIVDGKVVVVQREIVEVDPDEFDHDTTGNGNKEHPNTRRPKGPRKIGQGFSVGVNAGGGIMFGNVSTNASGFETLAEFISDNKSMYFSYLIHGGINYHFNKKWSIHTGVGLWSARMKNVYFKEEDLTQDSLLGFLSNSNGSLSQYYWFEVGPGAETDTTEMQLYDTDLKITSLDFPFVLRHTFTDNDSRGSGSKPNWFAGAGFVLTSFGAKSGGPFQLVNSSGDYQQLGITSLNVPSISVNPVLEGGMRWWMQDHMIFEWQLRIPLHLFPLNDATTYQISYHRAFLTAGFAYFF